MKGTKPNKMPRKSKKRGSASTKRGISNEQVGVFTAFDDVDRTLIEIAGLGPESLEKLLPYKERSKKGSLLVSESNPGYKQFAAAGGMSLDQLPFGARKNKINNNLATVNGLHGELRQFLSSYKGVSIRLYKGI